MSSGGGPLSNLVNQSSISISDAINKQANALTRSTKRVHHTPVASAPTVDPYTALMAQLQNQLNSVSPNKYLTPLEQLRQQANSSVSAQYDPQISALGNEMNRTEARGKRNQHDVRAMYDALSKGIAAQLPEITNQMHQAENEAKSRYGQAKSEIQGNYDQAAAEQNAIMKQLGIQAAAPDANKEMNQDEAYFKSTASQDQQQVLDALSQIQAGAEQYNSQSANNAQLAGTNAATDIKQQLEDYMQQANSQLTALSSGKQSAIAAMLAQLQGADQQRAEGAAQSEQNRIMQLANFQLNAEKAFNDQQLQQQKLALQQSKQQDASAFKGTTGLSGATRFLAEAYPDEPARATALSSLVASVLSDPSITSGQQTVTDPNTGLKSNARITPEYIMQKIREAGTAKGFQDSDINNAIDAYYAYAGKLR